MANDSRWQILALALTSSCALWAQGSKPPLSPMPPNGFQFSGFTGDVILGDKWIELTEHDIEPATGYLAKYLIGNDPQQKRIVEFDANNFAAAVYSSEEGWQDHVLTMTS